MTGTLPRTDIDLYTDESILDPYPDYAALQQLGSAVWLDAYGVYAVARYRDVFEALHDHTTFISGEGVGLTETLNKAQKGSSFTSDPPYHDFVRGIVARHLKPRALQEFHEYIENWADTLIRQLIERDTFDAVTDFAQAFPLAVVPDLLGWPVDEGRERLLEWASAGFNAFGPLNERTMSGIPLLKEMGEFLHRMSQPGNLRPGSWGATLVQEAKDGKIDDRLLPGLLGDFLAPSMDTSVSALASMLWLFGSRPDQWAALRANPSRIPNAFNELIRIESPLRGFTRLATAERRLGDAVVPSGARVLLLFGAANRDPRQFPDPDRFDITRTNAATHVGFGHGIHGCVGQALSRLEGHSLLQSLLRHVDRIEVGEPTWRLHNTVRGIASMPVTFRT